MGNGGKKKTLRYQADCVPVPRATLQLIRSMVDALLAQAPVSLDFKAPPVAQESKERDQ